EYLLEIPENSTSHKKESPAEINKAIRLYHKFDAHLEELEKLSASERELVLSLMKTINAARKN
ncbi:MAG: hypothetical protein II814_05650, partial [Treponema sp.]|nr:hypothetical protein [Treponema sp.]